MNLSERYRRANRLPRVPRQRHTLLQQAVARSVVSSATDEFGPIPFLPRWVAPVAAALLMVATFGLLCCLIATRTEMIATEVVR